MCIVHNYRGYIIYVHRLLSLSFHTDTAVSGSIATTTSTCVLTEDYQTVTNLCTFLSEPCEQSFYLSYLPSNWLCLLAVAVHPDHPSVVIGTINTSGDVDNTLVSPGKIL